jgi:hypothetical protein
MLSLVEMVDETFVAALPDNGAIAQTLQPRLESPCVGLCFEPIGDRRPEPASGLRNLASSAPAVLTATLKVFLKAEFAVLHARYEHTNLLVSVIPDGPGPALIVPRRSADRAYSKGI